MAESVFTDLDKKTLQELLEEFSERKLQGATVINSHGMMQELSELEV